MARRSLLLPTILLVLTLGAASCKTVVNVGVIGDSHSDVHRDPRADWELMAPVEWIIHEHAVSGASCWHRIPEALAEGVGGDTFVIYCGTNDAGRTDWDLETTAGWIQMAALHALSQGRRAVVVTPPPVFRDYPVHHNLRNQRLFALRQRIFQLASEYEIEVADVWDSVWAQPEPESLFTDGLHLTGAGRVMSYQLISEAVDRAND